MRTVTRTRAVCAFTLTELVVVAVIFGLLAAIFIPNLIRARDSARLNVIYSNLRKLEEAKEAWACENRKGEGASVGSVHILADYLRRGGVQPVVDERYIPNPIGIPAGAQLPAGVSVGPHAAGTLIPAP